MSGHIEVCSQIDGAASGATGDAHALGVSFLPEFYPIGTWQGQGELEYYLLRDLEAYANLAEHFNTRSVRRADAATLARRVACGPIAPAGPPTPLFTDVQQRLARAGIRMDFTGDRLTFCFAPPAGPGLKLARPVRHPWLREHMLAEIGACDELPEYQACTTGNAKVARLIASDAPAPLIRQALTQLEQQCQALFEAAHDFFQARERLFKIGLLRGLWFFYGR